MKAQYGIPENSCGDCCTHFWCETCALCQEYRELQYRGYDVALGNYHLLILTLLHHPNYNLSNICVVSCLSHSKLIGALKLIYNTSYKA